MKDATEEETVIRYRKLLELLDREDPAELHLKLLLWERLKYFKTKPKINLVT